MSAPWQYGGTVVMIGSASAVLHMGTSFVALAQKS